MQGQTSAASAAHSKTNQSVIIYSREDERKNVAALYAPKQTFQPLKIRYAYKVSRREFESAKTKRTLCVERIESILDAPCSPHSYRNGVRDCVSSLTMKNLAADFSAAKQIERQFFIIGRIFR